MKLHPNLLTPSRKAQVRDSTNTGERMMLEGRRVNHIFNRSERAHFHSLSSSMLALKLRAAAGAVQAVAAGAVSQARHSAGALQPQDRVKRVCSVCVCAWVCVHGCVGCLRVRVCLIFYGI